MCIFAYRYYRTGKTGIYGKESKRFKTSASYENARLRKALEYSELRNEALNEVLKIGKEKYGIDLLKKAGAKQ